MPLFCPTQLKRDTVSAECDMRAKSTLRSEALKSQALTCLYVFVLLSFILSLCEPKAHKYYPIYYTNYV